MLETLDILDTIIIFLMKILKDSTKNNQEEIRRYLFVF
jgi:hypothetical protein